MGNHNVLVAQNVVLLACSVNGNRNNNNDNNVIINSIMLWPTKRCLVDEHIKIVQKYHVCVCLRTIFWFVCLFLKWKKARKRNSKRKNWQRNTKELYAGNIFGHVVKCFILLSLNDIIFTWIFLFADISAFVRLIFLFNPFVLLSLPFFYQFFSSFYCVWFVGWTPSNLFFFSCFLFSGIRMCIPHLSLSPKIHYERDSCMFCCHQFCSRRWCHLFCHCNK